MLNSIHFIVILIQIDETEVVHPHGEGMVVISLRSTVIAIDMAVG